MQIIINVSSRVIGELEIIAKTGEASHGHPQDVEFCIQKAIEEFIRKYKRPDGKTLEFYTILQNRRKTYDNTLLSTEAVIRLKEIDEIKTIFEDIFGTDEYEHDN